MLPQASTYNPSLMSLSPDAPLEVLRDHVVSMAESHYVGKIAIVCGMFLVFYEWCKCCFCPFKRRLIRFPSDISRQRGTTTPHLKLSCSHNYAHSLDSYYLGMASQVR